MTRRLRGLVLAGVLLAVAAVGTVRCTSHSNSDRGAESDRALLIPFADKLMLPLAAQVFAEPSLNEADNRELLIAHGTAVANVRRFFGEPRNGPPLTLFCRTAACKMTFGAPPDVAVSADLGFARDGVQTKAGFLSTPMVVVTGPVFNTSRILTHELVHAEMKAWVSYDALPTWFNEGMATWVAGEPDCRSNPPVSDFDVRQLDTKEKWQSHIRGTHSALRTYCQARDEVSLWAGRFPDAAGAGLALKALLRSVAAGQSFESAFALELSPTESNYPAFKGPTTL